MKIDKDKLSAALDNIGTNYRKILLVNLSSDKYTIVTMADDEWEILQNVDTESKISAYWHWFCGSEFLHPDDRQSCLDYAKDVQPNTHIVYRRKIDGEWHFVLMELIPAAEYTPTNRACVLYVRDIHGIYQPEYESIIERLGTKDEFTGLLNRVAFEKDKAKHQGDSVGLLFGDINGLKYTNDKYGHKAGDELILKFANLLSLNFDGYRIYHISGDEFIVCGYGMSLHEFVRRAVAFHKSIWVSADFPIASVGYSVGEQGEFAITLDEAEKEMYEDKRMFYTQYPEYKRK